VQNTALANTQFESGLSGTGVAQLIQWLRYGLNERGIMVPFLAGVEIFIITVPIPALGPTQARMQWVLGGGGGSSFPRAYSDSEVNNRYSWTSFPHTYSWRRYCTIDSTGYRGLFLPGKSGAIPPLPHTSWWCRYSVMEWASRDVNHGLLNAVRDVLGTDVNIVHKNGLRVTLKLRVKWTDM
jgi:hypothetical protein